MLNNKDNAIVADNLSWDPFVKLFDFGFIFDNQESTINTSSDMYISSSNTNTNVNESNYYSDETSSQSTLNNNTINNYNIYLTTSSTSTLSNNSSSNTNNQFLIQESEYNTDHQPKSVILYKTELCDSFTNSGHCRYNDKCKFAHGENELKQKQKPKNYKTKLCKNYYDYGKCPYGKRCCFLHKKNLKLDLMSLKNENSNGCAAKQYQLLSVKNSIETMDF